MPYTPYQYANNTATTVAGGNGGLGTPLNPTDTTLHLPTGKGALYPSVAPFLVGVGTGIAKCTVRSGDTLTLVRGQNLAAPDGPTATDPSWPLGTTVQLIATADSFSNIGLVLSHALNGRYNVRDYGALGDGSTDDTTAITAANSAANSAGGGLVYFPAGTYITSTQTINPLVHYVGDGTEVSIIKLKNGANADLFSAQTGSINLAAANKTGADGTLYGFSFSNLTLDGNNTNQSSGTSWPLRFYAYHYRMVNLDIRNGYSGVVLADWNGPDNQVNGVSIESQWSNVKIFTTLGGPLIQFGGPHDSQFSNVLIFDGKNSAYDSTGSLTPGFHVGPNAAGVIGTNVHSWNNNLPFLLEQESYWANCVADISNRGTNQGIGVLMLSGLINWTGGSVFGSSGSSAATGFYVGQTAGATPKSPYMTAQSAGLTTAVAPQKCYVDTVILNTDNGGINFVNSGGNNIWSGLIHNGSGSSTGGIQGTVAGGDTLRVRVANITPDGNVTTGGAWNISLKSKQALNVMDPANGHETLRVDTFNNRIQVPYAATVLGYSDAFTTGTWSINKNAAGEMISGGYFAGAQTSGSAPATASSGTIAVGSLSSTRVNPAGNITGVIMAAGAVAGQRVTVINESAFTITFAASGTSRVADGVSDIIPAGPCARTFEWNAFQSLWYKCV